MRINHSCITDGLLAVVDLYGDDAAYLVDERTLAPVKIDIANDTVIVNSTDFRDGTLLATDIIIIPEDDDVEWGLIERQSGLRLGTREFHNLFDNPDIVAMELV